MKYIYSLFLIFLCICCDKDEVSNHHHIRGETITLSGFEYNSLLYQHVYNVIIYSLDAKGAKKTYLENEDYIIDGNRIRRIEGSTIPDFSKHRVEYLANGKFVWTKSPVLNPELTIGYQIYVDYEYSLSDEQMLLPFKHIIPLDRSLKVISCGTSITVGIHTFDNYYAGSDSDTYPYLLAKAIKRMYGIDAIVENKSIDGGTISQFSPSKMQAIIEGQPDSLL